MRNLLQALIALAWVRTRGRVVWLFVLLISLACALLLGRLGQRVSASLYLDTRDAGAYVPLIAAKATLWGPGVLAVLFTSVRAWAKDSEEGILALVRHAGHDPARYLRARGVVLALVLIALQLLTLAAVHAMARTPLHGTLPALAYGVAGSVVLALLGAVCLGPRQRPGGTLLLWTLLFGPEILSVWTTRIVARELSSIPALLETTALAVGPEAMDGARLTRALLALTLLALALALWLRVATRRWVQKQVTA